MQICNICRWNKISIVTKDNKGICSNCAKRIPYPILDNIGKVPYEIMKKQTNKYPQLIPKDEFIKIISETEVPISLLPIKKIDKNYKEINWYINAYAPKKLNKNAFLFNGILFENVYMYKDFEIISIKNNQAIIKWKIEIIDPSDNVIYTDNLSIDDTYTENVILYEQNKEIAIYKEGSIANHNFVKYIESFNGLLNLKERFQVYKTAKERHFSAWANKNDNTVIYNKYIQKKKQEQINKENQINNKKEEAKNRNKVKERKKEAAIHEQDIEIIDFIFNSHTKEEFERRYKNLVKKYHPDNNKTGDNEKFLKIINAYESIKENFTD